MRLVLLLISLVLVVAAPVALATEPSSGTVSKSSPKFTWKGAVTGFAAWQLYNQGQGACEDPSCDSLALEVADAGANLVLTVSSKDSNLFVEVVKPDGSKQLFGGEAMTVKATVKDAPAGPYTINVAQNEATQGAHDGTAELVFPSSDVPPPAGATTPPPASTPPAPAQLTLRAPRPSARKIKRSLKVGITSSAPVSNVLATLSKGRKVVGRASLGALNGDGTLKLKLRGKLKAGSYTLKVTATDQHGRSVAKTGKVNVKR